MLLKVYRYACCSYKDAVALPIFVYGTAREISPVEIIFLLNEMNAEGSACVMCGVVLKHMQCHINGLS